jgi:hypothetical protein
MISASEIAQREQARRNLRKETYKTILEQFSKKIMAASERSERHAHLKVPPMVIGYPLYPFHEATVFLHRQLVLSGYTVRQGLEPGEYMVTWEKARPAPKAQAPPQSLASEDMFSSLANLQKTAQKIRKNN